MPVAKVVLSRGGLSHTYKGRKWKRQEPQTVTTQSEIDYYKTTHGFSVTMLSVGSRKSTKLSKKDEPTKTKKVYTEEKLLMKKKKRLILIAEELDVPLTGNEKKEAIVEAILLAQDEE
jgi:hypothetical protein